MSTETLNKLNSNTNQQKVIREIFNEIGKQLTITTKETTKALNKYRSMYRSCLNSGNLNDSSLLSSEAEWNKKQQTMETLEQIKKILETNKNESGVYHTEAIDRELMSYTILSTQKELFDIAKLFSDYREKIFNY